MDGALVIALLVFVTVFAAITIFGSAGDMEQRAIVERIAQPLPQRTLAAALSIFRTQRGSRVPWFDRLVGRLNMAQRLTRELERAAIPMRAEEFFLVQIALALAVAAVAFFALRTTIPAPIALIAGAAVGFLAPRVWLKYKRFRRIDRFEEMLPDALDLVAGSLKAGYGLEHGIDLVARELEGPCAEEFGQMLQELNLGDDLESVIGRMVERVDSEDARLLGTAVAVQRRTGGNLVDVLQSLSGTIRERLRLRRDVRVITTAPRVSGYVVGALPLFVGVMMYFTSRYYIERLFAEPLLRVLVLVGVLWMLLGLYVSHRIASIDA